MRDTRQAPYRPGGTLVQATRGVSRCHTDSVPLTHGSLILEVLIAFATIGVLAFVLRWTFRREPGGPTPPSTLGDPDDFGLLATVAIVDTRDEAIRVRALLGEAGIRASVSTTGGDRRYRVLVFGSELDRARRVGGWSA